MLESILGRARRLVSKLAGRKFPGSASYWDARYATGGNSGSGSYNRLAEFKADYLNRFVEQNDVGTVIELGCGDGNQLSLAKYPNYFGVDPSRTAIDICRGQFGQSSNMEFSTIAPPGRSFDLALSLDVIYHLIEDDVFEKYMNDLFDLSSRYVIIYSSDLDQGEFNQLFPTQIASHVKHRRFSDWVESNAPGWHRIDHVRNKFPFDPADPNRTSFADFHVYERQG